MIDGLREREWHSVYTEGVKLRERLQAQAGAIHTDDGVMKRV